MEDLKENEGFVGEFAIELPVFKRLSYWIPANFEHRAIIGARAIVPVGKKRKIGFYMGKAGRQLTFQRSKLKKIEGFIDESPIFTPKMLGFLLKAASYYRCPEGMVLKTASSAFGKISGRKRLSATENAISLMGTGKLSEMERGIIKLTLNSPKTVRQIQRYIPLVNMEKLDEMCKRGFLEEVNPKKLSRRSTHLAIFLADNEWKGRQELLSQRQKSILEALERSEGITISSLSRLMKLDKKDINFLKTKGFIRIEEIQPSFSFCFEGNRIQKQDGETSGEVQLSEAQMRACSLLKSALLKGEFQTFLLFGVTGSGKTEVYLRTILSALEMGKSSIVIVPEIALTPQLVDTFKRRIGEGVAVIHSALPEETKRKQMKEILEGKRRVVVGARSALFSNPPDLGVFVVDEEHDTSLKQEEGFRYNARDMAILRAKEEGAVAILSSATPSMESFYNAMNGKYKLLQLPERVSPNPLPEVEVIDSRKHFMGPLGQTYISMPLYKAIGETLAGGGQVMIFLNRRGYAPVCMCKNCGEGIKCPDCSVILTFHRFTSTLACHHCGFNEPVPQICPNCGSRGNLEIKGPGTERIEEIVKKLFPSAGVIRMDSDVASGTASEPILRKLREGKADILVGTQMITKGHDIPRVALVGVVRADSELNFPDFRAAERTFSVLTQVAGRAGRGKLRGKVILQTFVPDHPAIEAAARQNYGVFYSWEIKNRKALFYPPFSYLALLRVEGPTEDKTMETAKKVAEITRNLCRESGHRMEVLGPAPSPISKISKRYRYQVLLKAGARKILGEAVDEVLRRKNSILIKTNAKITVDIDPVDFM